MASAQPSAPLVRVSEIGEFIRFNSCERRFKLAFGKQQSARTLPFFDRLFSPLDVVLQEAGKKAEQKWERQLLDQGFQQILGTSQDDDAVLGRQVLRTSWEDFGKAVSDVPIGKSVFGREVVVKGKLGAFEVEGAVDFLALYWKGSIPVLRIVEGKHSRKDRTYHRIQVVTYLMLVQKILNQTPLNISGQRLAADGVEAIVARIQEDTGEPEEIMRIQPLTDMDRERLDIGRLLEKDGRLEKIVARDIDSVEYRLWGLCDGCSFSVHCLPESGRQRRLELLGLEPVTIRELRNQGLRTIDDLADLDLDGPVTEALRTKPSFGESLARMKAKARARKSTLPRGSGDPDKYEIVAIPGAGQSQLPIYLSGTHPLIRVYLAVDYDYTENRVGALSAHVTHSDRELVVGWKTVEGKALPDEVLYERERIVASGPDFKTTYGPPSGIDPERLREIVKVQSSPWTGNNPVDTGMEKSLLQDFFLELVDGIEAVAGGIPECGIHFYLWSANEMSRLVEACSRADSKLLGHLRQLMGSRDSLEQLIFSCVGEEVDRRYGQGWTGRGLVVASSLGWFGQRFHWTRFVKGQSVRLDEVFTQDLFDFKTELGLNSEGEWVKERVDADIVHKFEIRSRNFDSLPAPYWRSAWKTLPKVEKDTKGAKALERYSRADRNNIRAYLLTRLQALRWVEERCYPKNRDIVKPPIRISDLPTFDLGVDTIGQASIDVLRLDSHIGASRWISLRLAPINERVAAGITVPLRNIRATGTRAEIAADIDLDRFQHDPQTMESTWVEDAMIRLTIYSGDPKSTQTISQLANGGITAILKRIDWGVGTLLAETIQGRSSRYVFGSADIQWCTQNMQFATLDDSPSNYVSGRVESALLAGSTSPAMAWFDPIAPEIPEAPPNEEERVVLVRQALRAIKDEGGHGIDESQCEAIVEGLATTVQLLQGPPGTGKTATTALSILSRIWVRRSTGDILLVASNTHTAVDEILTRTVGYFASFRDSVIALGGSYPDVQFARIDPSIPLNVEVLELDTGKGLITKVDSARRNSVVVAFGTTNGVLKFSHELGKSKRKAFPISEVIVDEASMMVFPHFLAIASLLHADGKVLLAGDNRQLSPILAHDWENEDRPPIELYQPHLSAYDAIFRLSQNPTLSKLSILKNALNLTFRLPPRVVSLIARVYEQDKIVLRGLPRPDELPLEIDGDIWKQLWKGNAGLFLVVHNERASRKFNSTEIAILGKLIDAAPVGALVHTAIVTPHRAQRQQLKNIHGDRVGTIDTVERLQGGQRKTVIVSGCASDPGVINSSAEFILDLRRSNVAFSRVQDRLIVVCSRTLLDAIPPDIESYDSAMLWKQLRATCTHLISESIIVEGHEVSIFAPPEDETRTDV